ncbi:MAG: sodium:calcium antiporter [Candidatus Zixiibacteriota bacterium]|nr:MAG: sodium:calcium antiporter [candidate division Zixibacteria bacterium]
MTSEHKLPVSTTSYVYLVLAFLVAAPGLYCGITDTHVTPWLGAIMFGVAVFGAAFILSWAAEAAQVDISESLAVAILALVAVLPEYAVDFVFTWKSAHDPSQAHYAIANMTGSNRLLVGLGWPAVLLAFIVARKRKELVLDKSQRVEIFYLAIATLYSFTIPLKGYLNLIDTVILVTIFVMYTRRAAQMESVEPEFVGPTKILANMRDGPRRLFTAFFFIFSGTAIFFVAEPFAESLVATGSQLGVDEFLLIQWLAPIASEAPEFIVAITWALRGAGRAAIKVLISSKVNQWTLLLGTIPLVFAISGQAVRPFVLDGFQQQELWLTAAQSLFGVAVLANLRMSRANGLLLASLFTAQLIISQIRVEVAILYMALAVFYHVKHRDCLFPAAREGLGMREKVSG